MEEIQVLDIDKNVTKKMEIDIKEKVITGFKQFSNKADVADFIREKMEKEYTGKWFCFILPPGKGGSSYYSDVGTDINLKYHDHTIIIFRHNK